jgi:hypothetical protein
MDINNVNNDDSDDDDLFFGTKKKVKKSKNVKKKPVKNVKKKSTDKNILTTNVVGEQGVPQPKVVRAEKAVSTGGRRRKADIDVAAEMARARYIYIFECIYIYI